jgi:hypothetical protein
MTQLTFLMGTDGSSTNAFYSLAAQFFAPRADNKTIAPTAAQGYLTLEDVFATLTAAKAAPSVINIVSHAMGFGFMSFPMTRARRDANHEDSTGLDELTASDAPVLNVKGITGRAQVVIYGCDIGRSSRFVYRLAQLFGCPLQIFAPRRVACFQSQSGSVVYRLAQTWTVPATALGHIPKDNADSDWPAFHARFVVQVDASFGPMAATAGGAAGRKQLEDLITAKATNQTYDQSTASFFFTESVSASVGTVTVSNPLVNGDPPPPIYPPSAIAVDDTWVVTRLTDKNGVLNGASLDFPVMVLASIIETAVDFSDGFSFLSLYTAPQLAPQKPSSAGSPTGAASSPATPPVPGSDLGSLTDRLVAAGLSQADLDLLLAALAPPAAGDDGLVSADPGVPPTDDPDDANIDQLLPIEDV